MKLVNLSSVGCLGDPLNIDSDQVVAAFWEYQGKVEALEIQVILLREWIGRRMKLWSVVLVIPDDPPQLTLVIIDSIKIAQRKVDLFLGYSSEFFHF